MKKCVSVFLAACMLCMVIMPAYANYVQWNLNEKPGFSGYVLCEYGDIGLSSPILLELSEANLNDGELAALTNEFLAIIDAVAFVPGDYTAYKTGDEIILAYFVAADREQNSTTDIQLYLTEKGVYFGVWDRSSQTTRSAFVSCATENIIAQIRALMTDTVEGVEANRAEADAAVRAERAAYETVLASFEKHSYVKAADVSLYNEFGVAVTISFETGICSYQISGSSETKYAYYFDFGGKGNTYYICHQAEDGTVSYNDVSIYKIPSGSHQGSYCIYESPKDTVRVETSLQVDEAGYVEEIYILVKHSAFEGTIGKDALTQVGSFKDYNAHATGTEQTEAQPSSPEEAVKEEPSEQPASDLPKDEEEKEEEQAEEKTEEKTVEQETTSAEEKGEDIISEEPVEQAQAEPVSENVQYADALNMLGLFKGTGMGYELEANMTRAQGAAMLVRLLGEEAEALSGQPRGVFSDVSPDHWAAPYVEYCYQYSITKGTGGNQYSPDEPLSGSQFMTLVLRALGYVDSEPQTSQTTAQACALLSAEEAYHVAQRDIIDRNIMVYISHRALTTAMKSGDLLIDSLIAKEAVDKNTAQQLGFIQ